MGPLGWRIHLALRTLFFEAEEGQDLVEFALILALIALGATVGMHHLGRRIYWVFRHLARIFGGYS